MASDYIHPSQLWSLPVSRPQALRIQCEILRLHFLQKELTWAMNSSAVKLRFLIMRVKHCPWNSEDPFQISELLPTSWTCHGIVFSTAPYICQAIPSARNAPSSFPSLVNSQTPSGSRFQCNHFSDAFVHFPGRKSFPLCFLWSLCSHLFLYSGMLYSVYSNSTYLNATCMPNTMQATYPRKLQFVYENYLFDKAIDLMRSGALSFIS